MKARHHLSDVDENSRSANCSIDGPVGIVRSHEAARSPEARWACKVKNDNDNARRRTIGGRRTHVRDEVLPEAVDPAMPLPPATGRIPTGESIAGMSPAVLAVLAPFARKNTRATKSAALKKKREADAAYQPEGVFTYRAETLVGLQRMVIRGVTRKPAERMRQYVSDGHVITSLELERHGYLADAFYREYELDEVIREDYAALGVDLGPTGSSEVYAIYEVAPEDPDVVRARDDAYLDEPRGLRDLGAGPDE